MLEILLGIIIFTAFVIALVFVIIGAKSKLVAEGDVEILINNEKNIHVPVGSKLLTALADNGLFVSSACGGGGPRLMITSSQVTTVCTEKVTFGIVFLTLVPLGP